VDTSSDVAWLSGLLHTKRGPVDKRTVEELDAHLVTRIVERGQVLIKAGETPDGVWIIRRGLVELVMGTSRRRRVVQLLREGDILGDSFLALAADSPYTARAVDRSEMLFLPADGFEALLRDHPRLASWWLANALARLAKSRVRIVEVLGRTLHERVARLLVDEAVDESLRLPQKTLAEMLGVQRSSLNKVLHELENQGLVAIGYSRVELKDRAKLLAMASGERI
jgi:CRP/FNR family transcriptional regulator, cAMP and macrophage regulator